MKRKLILSLVLVLTIAFIVTVSTSIFSFNINQEEYHWRFSYTGQSGSFMDQYAQRFKDQIESKTEGRVVVELYPASILGTGEDMIEHVQNNVVHFNLVSDRDLSSYIPEAQIFQLEYLFPDNTEEITELINSEKFDSIIGESYAGKNIFPLGYIVAGWEVISANNQITHPDHLKNYDFRVPSNKFTVKNYEEYGANVLTTDFAEVYSGLHFGLFDGQISTLPVIEEMGFYEVQDYLIQTKSNPDINILVTNPLFHSSLSEDIKDILNEVILDMQNYSQELQNEYYSDRLERMISRNAELEVVNLSPKERELFKLSAQEVWGFYENSYGEKASQLLNYIIELN